MPLILVRERERERKGMVRENGGREGETERVRKIEKIQCI